MDRDYYTIDESDDWIEARGSRGPSYVSSHNSHNISDSKSQSAWNYSQCYIESRQFQSNPMDRNPKALGGSSIYYSSNASYRYPSHNKD